MYLVLIGAVLVLLKYFEIDPVAAWSWWWILTPLAVAIVWFEWLEKAFGKDRRRQDHVEYEKNRKDRVAQQFSLMHKGKKPR